MGRRQRRSAAGPRRGAGAAGVGWCLGSAASPSSPWRWASALLLRQVLGVASVALTFLTAVLVSAVATACGRRCCACLASVLAYNFFFLPPLYTFTIADPENVVALFFFAVVAVIASNLTARVRAQAIAARQRGAHDGGAVPVQPQAGGRGEPGRPAVGDGAPDRADAEGACRHAAARGRRIAVRAGYPPEDALDEADLAAAKWCWEQNRAGGARVRHAAGREAAVHADAHRPRRGRRDRHRPRRAGPDPDARSAPAAGCAGRPGGAGDRAREPGARTWTARGWRPRPTGCARRC